MQSPNYEHLKYAVQWIDAYPEATSYACPGLMEMHPEIPYTTSVGVDQTTPESWPSEVCCFLPRALLLLLCARIILLLYLENDVPKVLIALLLHNLHERVVCIIPGRQQQL